MTEPTMTVWRIGSLAAAIALAGCSGKSSVGAVAYVTPSYDYSVLVKATTGRNVPVRIVGQPFPQTSKAELENAVVAAMPSGFLNRAQYIVDPGGIAGGGARIVWHFDPAGLIPDEICAAKTRTGPGQRGLALDANGVAHIRAVVALCINGGAYVANVGTVEATGPNDPRLASFIDDMVLTTLAGQPGRTEYSGSDVAF